MFGRSGQMFPNRPYGDGMYEEDYGSETDDDCCCCRGCRISSIVCWCCSFITIMGLAVSIVLTVFFVLKSRSLLGGTGGSGTSLLDDLDLFYGFKNKNETMNDTIIVSTSAPPTTITTEFDISHLMKSDVGDFTSTEESTHWNHPVHPIQVSTIKIFSTLSPTVLYTPPTTQITSVLPSLATMSTTIPTPTITITRGDKSGQKMNGLGESEINLIKRPSRFEDDISTTSNENWASIIDKDSASDENLSTTSHTHVLFSMPPSSDPTTPSIRRRRPQVTKFPILAVETTLATLTTTGADNSLSLATVSQPSTTETPPVVTSAIPSRTDLLERIIKNLAPKFNNKTEIISSRERLVPVNPNVRIKTMIRLPTSTNSPDSHQLSFDDVQPASTDTEEQQQVSQFSTDDSAGGTKNFLDIIAGNEKRLVTTETESGTITSAILPSWFVNDTESFGRPLMSNSSMRFPDDEEDELQLEAYNVRGSDEDSGVSEYPHPPPVGRFPIFSPEDEPQWNPNHFSPTAGFTNFSNPQVTKKPINILFRDILKELAPKFSILNYDRKPESVREPDRRNRQKYHGSRSSEENIEGAPSHVIHIAYDPKQRPEIVIEADGSVDPDHITPDGSAFEPQVIPPPSDFNTLDDDAGSFVKSILSTLAPLNQSIALINLTTVSGLGPGATKNPLDVKDPGQMSQPGEFNTTLDNALTSVASIPIWNHTTRSELGDTSLTIPPSPTPFAWSEEAFDEALTGIDNQTYDENESQFPRHPISQLDSSLFRPIQIPSPVPSSEPVPTIVSFSQSTPLETTLVPTMTTTTASQELTTPSFIPFMPTNSEIIPFSASQEDSTPNYTINQTNFLAPEPIDFHSNGYGFRPSSITSTGTGFVPVIAENWRPLLFEKGSTGEKAHSASSEGISGTGSYFSSGGSVLPSFSEALKLRPTTTMSQLDESVDSTLQSSWTGIHSTPRKPPLSIPLSNHNEHNPAITHFHHSAPPHQFLPPPPPPINPGRIKFPTSEQETASQINLIVFDRSKYMHRPAPPPILMRRHPQPPPPESKRQRKPPRGPIQHYLSQQQQIQQQRLLKERLVYQQQMAKIRQRSTEETDSRGLTGSDVKEAQDNFGEGSNRRNWYPSIPLSAHSHNNRIRFGRNF